MYMLLQIPKFQRAEQEMLRSRLLFVEFYSNWRLKLCFFRHEKCKGTVSLVMSIYLSVCLSVRPSALSALLPLDVFS
jgi:hypothetical protein